MPIPSSRKELVGQVTSAYDKLDRQLREGGPDLGHLPCIDDWTVKDLLAVRAWWTERVVSWIESGKRGEIPVIPDQGYRWNETPRLNANIVRKSQGESYAKICRRLDTGYRRALALIDSLNDAELLDIGVFEWASKWPVSRWISINTARQYTTASTYIRRAVRADNSARAG